jgi:hypothetical protein
LAYVLDGLEWTGFVQGTALNSFWVVVFYAAIRSGLNLKLRDPSLTAPQLYTSVLTMAYIMYYRVSPPEWTISSASPWARTSSKRLSSVRAPSTGISQSVDHGQPDSPGPNDVR